MFGQFRDPAPAHVGHGQARGGAQLVRGGRENTQAFRRVFLRALRKKVHAETDAEDRLGQPRDDAGQAGLFEPVHAVGRGADTGQDDVTGSADGGRVRGANAVGPETIEGGGQ